MIQVINRSFDIMELIAKDPESPLPLSTIADTLGMNHGTCANILKTLVSRGYIEQMRYKKGYCLGPKLYSLAHKQSYKHDLVQASRDVLIGLSQKVKENTLLAIIKENKRLILYEVASTQDLQVHTVTEKNIYESSTGRLLLAHLDENELETFLKKYGLPVASVWKDANNRKSLESCLSRIRKEGIAIQSTSQQVVGISTPVTKDKNVIASIGIYMPELRFKKENKKLILTELVKAASAINHKLAH